MRREPVRMNFMLIALLPVFAHIVLFSITIFKDRHIYFGKLDLLILSLFMGYLLGLIFTLRYKEYFIRLVLMMYSLLFAIAGIELFLQFTSNFPAGYMPREPMRTIIQVVEGVMPGVSNKAEFSINKYGLRGPDMELSDADIKILCIGGSTTECLYVTDKLSWPWRLQDKLAQELGKKVFAGNAGRSGDSTSNHIETLQKYQLAPQFDWIIVLAGINDLGVFLWDNTTNAGLYYKRLKAYQYLTNIYYRRIVQDSRGKWLDVVRARRKLFLKSHPVNKIPPGLGQSVFIYKENLKKIISLCRERKQNLIMLTQPTLWRSDLPLHLQGLIWEHAGNAAHTLEILEELIGAYNQAMLDACKQEGVRCIDLASALSSDYSIFYDDCHLNIHGCEVVSEILAKEMAGIIKEQEKSNVPRIQ